MAIGLFWATLLLFMLWQWVRMKHDEDPSGWIGWGIAAVFLGALLAALWQVVFLKFVKAPDGEAERTQAIHKHRRLTARPDGLDEPIARDPDSKHRKEPVRQSVGGGRRCRQRMGPERWVAIQHESLGVRYPSSCCSSSTRSAIARLMRDRA